MTDHDTDGSPPRVFVTYTWDSESHKAWVLGLATRLIANGVDVVLDRWDARLGTDLPLFMEQGIGTASRVLAIVTEHYADKAYAGKGGASYERRLLTADLMEDLTNDRIITVLRDNPNRKIPLFLGQPVYLDFRQDSDFETRYAELVHNLHGREILPRPKLGANPFTTATAADVPAMLRDDPSRYVSPGWSGTVTFNHTNNDGQYVLGSGDMTFTLRTSEAAKGAVHMYRDPADIKTVALAEGVTTPTQVSDAKAYDASSRARSVREGDAGILRNQNDYWAVVCVDEVHTRASAPDGQPSLSFRYMIQRDRTSDFTNL